MEVTKSGDRVLFDLSVEEALGLARRMGQVLGVSEEEMNLVFEEVLG